MENIDFIHTMQEYIEQKRSQIEIVDVMLKQIELGVMTRENAFIIMVFFLIAERKCN